MQYTIDLYTEEGIKTETASNLDKALEKARRHTYGRGYDFGSCEIVGDAHFMEFWAWSAFEKSKELMATITQGE